ncbi:MAG: enoyl-CoA hydratase-related protein [Steroidobacteraceae bacterium]
MAQLPTFSTLRVQATPSVLTVWIDQPETRNALTSAVRAELTDLCGHLERDTEFRAVVLRGANGTFCSGGDLRDFKRQFSTPPPGAGQRDAIAQDNRQFGEFLLRLQALPHTLVALVEGSAFAGALGLICVSDIAIALADARFAISETTLGVIPAQIAPFVVARIGLTQARRLALMGSRFDGREAQRLGFVHSVHESVDEAEAELAAVLAGVRRCGREANATTKALLLRSASAGIAQNELIDWAADRFAERLRSAEGQEGVGAFLAKRRPSWSSS